MYALSHQGRYPSSCVGLASFSRLTEQFRVYVGESGGTTWDPFKVSDHDFTVMVSPRGYEIFLPTEQVKMKSFSSFEVWRYDSVARSWQRGRIHWTWGTVFWSDK